MIKNYLLIATTNPTEFYFVNVTPILEELSAVIAPLGVHQSYEKRFSSNPVKLKPLTPGIQCDAAVF